MSTETEPALQAARHIILMNADHLDAILYSGCAHTRYLGSLLLALVGWDECDLVIERTRMDREDTPHE